MKRLLLSLLDKLTVVFLYLNVLVPTLPLAGVAVSKISFSLLLLVYCVLMGLTRERVRSRLALYLFFSHFGMALLAITSWLQGNGPESIAGLASVVLIILIIPPLALLFQHYGSERYLRHLTNAIVLLAIAYLALVILCGPLNQRQIALYISESGTSLSSTVSFAFFPGGIRISTTNSGFLPAGLLLVYFRVLARGRWRDIVSLLIVGFAIYLCYTVSLWVSAALGLFLGTLLLRPSRGLKNTPLHQTGAAVLVSPGFKLSRSHWRKILLSVCVCIGAAYAAMRLPDFILDSKKESFDFKHRQLVEALDIFRSSPFTGKGLGYIYNENEFTHVSGSATTLLENSYAGILASTGLLGVVVLSFVYLFYPLILLGSRQTPPRLLLLIAHFMVLIQAWGNPFLWSGGLALIFASFLGADLEDPARPRPAERARLPNQPAALPAAPCP